MKKARVLFIWAGLGVVYFIWVLVTGLSISCPFRAITGWLCPGCGITTLLLSLAHLDFSSAYQANPFLFVTAPLLVAEFCYSVVLYWKNRRHPHWNQIAVIVYGIALCLFGVLRNLG